MIFSFVNGQFAHCTLHIVQCAKAVLQMCSADGIFIARLDILQWRNQSVDNLWFFYGSAAPRYIQAFFNLFYLGGCLAVAQPVVALEAMNNEHPLQRWQHHGAQSIPNPI